MTTTHLPGLGGRIAIRVYGVPIPQGSKRVGRHGKRPVILDNNDQVLAPWRAHVRATAEDVCRYHDIVTGPVRTWVRFTFTRPPSHFLTDGVRLRAGAPQFPGHGCGDVDKLLRAVLDAITGVAIHDDTQVVDVRARKFYAGENEHALDQAGVDIILEEI